MTATTPFICGFSDGRNLVKLDCPVREAVEPVLPICDRYVFLVGESADGTREMIRSIDPEKRGVVDSVWPETMTDGDVRTCPAHPPLSPRRNRWLSARFYRECLKHGVKL